MEKPVIEPITVSAFIDLINLRLKNEFSNVKIIGEVTQVKIASSGHVYFTLRDKEENYCLDCVIWSSNYRLNGVKLEEGMEIITAGKPEIYPARGSFNFICQTLELSGEGAWKKAYDALKLKLTKEGIFSGETKREPPRFVNKIGVITSKQGAVIHDFTNNLGLFGFKITFIDSRVEGQEALKDLLLAIRTMKKQDIDVLIIMRGGGSFQSLSAFDNETIVREIKTFPVPVISAIGHHKDVPLVAMASDIDVSTPTAAANFLTKPWVATKAGLNATCYKIIGCFDDVLHEKELSMRALEQIITEDFESILTIFLRAEEKFKRYLNNYIIHTQHLYASLNFKIYENGFNKITRVFSRNTQSLCSDYIVSKYSNIIKDYDFNLNRSEKIIELNSPTRLLEKGYSITRASGKIIGNVEDVKAGEGIVIQVKNGLIHSQVTEVQKKSYE